MNLEIIRLENQLMNSNCFIIVENITKSCIIIDPASEKSEREIKYIEEKTLHLDYIIVTHAHADHCWGVNTLKERYPESKIVYSADCYKNMKRSIMLFFKMWHEDETYNYDLMSADIAIDSNTGWSWKGHKIKFVLTPGHSLGSMCIDVDGKLFTGDTIMPFPPYFNGRGSNEDEWDISVKKIVNMYDSGTEIYPGHGEVLTIGEWKANKEYSEHK